MKAVKRAPLLLAAALIAGCGGSTPGPGKAVGPPGPPPKHPGGGPPAAWVETQRDAHWLAYSSYCWSGKGRAQCADFIPPRCGDPGIPTIYVEQGETVRFHLGFDPRRVEVSGAGGSDELTAERDPSWPARRITGPMTLSAHADGDSASYTACLRFMRMTTGLTSIRGTSGL